MPRRLQLSVFVLAAALLLTGCSGGGSDAASSSSQPSEAAETPDAAAATGETFTGSGYSLTGPEGWTDPGEQYAAQGVDLLIANVDDTDGFADNMNVVLSPAGELTADQIETAGVDELEGAGATDVTVRDRVTVAGSESAHISAIFSSDGTEYQIEQYYLTNAGQTYVVTFSFSTTVSQADRDALAQSVLATWTWA